MYLIVDTFAELRLAIVILYYVQSLVNGLLVLQWEHKPSAKQSSTHRRNGLIDNIE